MSFTFTTLKSAIQDYTENTETTFVNDLATIIVQAENRINSSVQLPNFRANKTAAVSTDNPYLTIPDDFLYPYSLAVLDGDSNYSYLLNKDVNFIREAYPLSGSNKGLPEFYAQFDNDYFIVAPTPDANYSVELHYFYLPTSIMKGEPDIISTYDNRYKEALSQLVVQNDGRNRKDAYRRGQFRIEGQ